MKRLKKVIKISPFSDKIIWKSFSEIKKLEEKNKRIFLLKKELNVLFKEKNYKALSLKILDFLREVLITSGENYPKKKELLDELYWFRYSFVDENEDSFLLDNVSKIFFEFQSDVEYSELIKKINSALKKLS